MLHRLLFAAWFALALSAGRGDAQTGPYNPGANFVSNQGWNAAAITVGTAYALARAIYNGNATACNITVNMNGGGSVQFTNVQPGEILPVQTTQVTASTCSTNTLIAIQ